MKLKLKDEFIDEDQIFGPLPNFEDTFEKFFIQKAADCILKNKNDNNDDQESQLSFESVSITDEENMSWMYDIDLAENSNNQNLEIIYNNNQVFYKTIKPIYKNDELKAFPSKDLEISLGLQFIQNNTENLYTCKKCGQIFNYQYHLMLHSRYFCIQNTNNLLKIVTGLSKSIHSFANRKKQDSNTNKIKRKLMTDELDLMSPKKKNMLLYSHNNNNTNNINNFNNNTTINEQENVYTNYFRKIVEHDPNITNQLKHFSHHMPIYNNFSPNEVVTNLLSNMISNNNGNIANIASMYQNLAINYQQQIAQQFAYVNQNNPNGNKFSNAILSYLDMRSKSLNEDSLSNQQSSPQNSVQSEPSSPSILSTPVTPTFQKNFTPPFFKPKLININERHSESNLMNPQPKPNNVPLNIESKLGDLQSIQNWCAKCNTHFRLTSDLVYHMRTFHRKEDPTFTNSKLPKLAVEKNKIPIAPFLENAQQTYDCKKDFGKYLRCEICNELFKEKHHLRRHLTSHR